MTKKHNSKELYDFTENKKLNRRNLANKEQKIDKN